MSESRWASTRDAADFYQVSVPTLRRWADTGKVPFRRTPSKQRQYLLRHEPDQPLSRINICYARVSSSKQKDDLQRQKEFLSGLYPGHELVTDIGSGINYKRRGLVSILEQVQDGTVGEIVVASKDRLCRFAYELIEWLCDQYHTKIVVLQSEDSAPEEELSAELLEIVQVFYRKRNGKRQYNKSQKTAHLS